MGLTLGAFWLKKKVHHMDGEKWEAYFQNLPTTALLMRLGVLLAVGVLLPLVGSMYQTTIFANAFLYVMLALGLNIIGGRVVCKPVADAWGLPYEPLAL